MKPIVNLMINEFHALDVGMDFMGYRITDPRRLSFHHLIVPKRKGGKETIENGALLMRNAHDYLHIIEGADKEVYEAIQREMVLENKSREIMMASIERIDAILNEFEEKHCEDSNEQGYYLIKDFFRRRVLRENDDRFYH